MIPGNINTALISGAEGGYAIQRSLRFNAPDSAYLSRTPASAGNRRTYTLSFWTKRATLSSSGYQAIFSAGTGSGANSGLYFSSDKLEYFHDAGSSGSVFSAAVLRDVSAWYHIIVSVDTTQSTAANRVKIYINGVDQALTGTQPTQNLDSLYINQTNAHNIGRRTNGDLYVDAYFSDFFFIDGQALDPTSFGEFSATTGVWMPKQYTGSYGTNGFHLDFSDNSTAAALGTDSSGAGNTWTVNNLSVTAGAGNDSLVDVPTNGSEVDTGLGGEVRGNYATLNPLKNGANNTLSNGNLTVVNSASATNYSFSTIALPSSGKYYFEATASANGGTTALQLGIFSTDHATTQTGSKRYWYLESGVILEDNTDLQTGLSTFTAGDVIACAYNADANTATWYKNGSQVGTAVSVSTSYQYYFGVGIYKGQWDVNFGQRSWAYQAPSGFKALNTANLPAPLVTKPSTVMDVKLYTGNGGTQTISGLGFSPDFVWVKKRNATANHFLADTVRGTTKALLSDVTDAEYTNANYITSFNSTGFSVGSDSGYNANGDTYAAWAWDAGSSTVTNTQGSISSQVRANASAGFSVVTFTKTANTNETIGHGLGVAPSLVIVKTRESSGYTGWAVYHISTGSNGYLELNTTSAFNTLSTTWNNTAPTSSVFSMGTGWTATQNMVAYCFAPVAGYSSMGSANGGNPSFVYTGFRPRFLMLKRTNSTSNWHIFDTSRSPYNASTFQLYANSSSAEDDQPADAIDFVSNGFVMRSTNSFTGASWIYYAVAESPFQYARAR